MIKVLLPYIKLYRHYLWQIVLGLSLAIVTLCASIFLLSLSGWFLAASAFVGAPGLYFFNYMLPAAGVRGAAITRTAARYFERLVNHDATFKILTYLRIQAFRHILPLSHYQLTQYQKADLLNRFIADIDNLDHLYLRLFTPIISGLTVTLLLFIGLNFINLQIAIVMALILLLTILILPIIFYQAGYALGTEIALQKNQYREQLISYLQGQAELLLFNANAHYRQQLEHTQQRWLTLQKQQAKLLNLSTSLIILIISIMVLLILWLAADGISGYQPPMIALFIFTALSCGEILAPIPNAFLFLSQVVASAKRMNEMMSITPDIVFPTQGKTVDLRYCDITFENVSFSYPNQPYPIIDNVSFNIAQGQHVSLIGATGCGKSTLLNLLTRSWQPTQGRILINQCDITEIDEPTLRSLTTVIPQTIDIFSDTLRANLQIANPKASDEILIEVLVNVGLDKLLLTEQKLDLWLGDNGRPLSGGEKRRIGIARALLHNAPLVLMDEPTESLDHATEQQILALIEQYYHNKTLIMVTHRLTGNPFFDHSLLLEHNRLINIYYE